MKELENTTFIERIYDTIKIFIFNDDHIYFCDTENQYLVRIDKRLIPTLLNSADLDSKPLKDVVLNIYKNLNANL